MNNPLKFIDPDGKWAYEPKGGAWYVTTPNKLASWIWLGSQIFGVNIKGIELGSFVSKTIYQKFLHEDNIFTRDDVYKNFLWDNSVGKMIPGFSTLGTLTETEKIDFNYRVDNNFFSNDEALDKMEYRGVKVFVLEVLTKLNQKDNSQINPRSSRFHRQVNPDFINLFKTEELWKKQLNELIGIEQVPFIKQEKINEFKSLKR